MQKSEDNTYLWSKLICHFSQEMPGRGPWRSLLSILRINSPQNLGLNLFSLLCKNMYRVAGSSCNAQHNGTSWIMIKQVFVFTVCHEIRSLIDTRLSRKIAEDPWSNCVLLFLFAMVVHNKNEPILLFQSEFASRGAIQTSSLVQFGAADSTAKIGECRSRVHNTQSDEAAHDTECRAKLLWTISMKSRNGAMVGKLKEGNSEKRFMLR